MDGRICVLPTPKISSQWSISSKSVSYTHLDVYKRQTLNYLGFLVINTVQLGATVDYAILLSDRYKESRRGLPAKEALCKTLTDNYLSILVSASILSSAGFCLYLTSSNQIISQLGLLLGRGTILSMLLVLFFLPALLLAFDPLLRITTVRSRFYRK